MPVPDLLPPTPQDVIQTLIDDPWLTVRQTADRAQSCDATVRRAIADGRVRARRLGNLWRLRASWVDAWLNADPPRDNSPEALERQLERARALSLRGRKAAAARCRKAKARR